MLKRVESLVLHVTPYTPLAGAKKADLPDWIANKKAVININNNDDRCLEWALLSALYPVEKDGQETSKYKKFLGDLDFGTIPFPVKVEHLARVEKLNNIQINCYGVDEKAKKIYPIHPANAHTGTNIIQLLIYDGHYMWIKNWNRLVRTQGTHKHICPICISASFKNQKNLDRHIETCAQFEAVRTKMPTAGCIEFKNHHHSNRVPVVVYADFESICVPVNVKAYFQEQKPASVRWRVVVAEGVEIPSLETDGDYVGEDAVKDFVKAMRRVSELCFPVFKEPPLQT